LIYFSIFAKRARLGAASRASAVFYCLTAPGTAGDRRINLRYGLWEIDFIINRAVVYGLLTTVLAAVWAAIAKLLEVTFAQVIGQSAIPLVAELAVLGVGLIFGPARHKLETWVNRHFYPHKLDLSRDFVEFLPEARATIGFSELLANCCP
jgi:hypothetical protein